MSANQTFHASSLSRHRPAPPPDHPRGYTSVGWSGGGAGRCRLQTETLRRHSPRYRPRVRRASLRRMSQTSPTALPLAQVLRFERTGLNALPALRTVFDRSWIVRIARGAGGASMKRANSVTCLDPEDAEDVPARIAWIEGIYRRFHLPAMFRVTPLTPPALDAALTERGYSAEDERVLLRAELTVPLRALKDGFPDQPAAEWFEVVGTTMAPERLNEIRESMALLALPSFYPVLRNEG